MTRAQPVRWSILKLGNRDWQLTQTYQSLALAFVFLVLTEQYFELSSNSSQAGSRQPSTVGTSHYVRSSQATTHRWAAAVAGQRVLVRAGDGLTYHARADHATNAPIRATRAHAAAFRYRTFRCDSEA
jgi:hypothetical protein